MLLIDNDKSSLFTDNFTQNLVHSGYVKLIDYYNIPNLCSMSHLHFHLPKVSSITFLVLWCCLLNNSSAGVRGSRTGVRIMVLKGRLDLLASNQTAGSD